METHPLLNRINFLNPPVPTRVMKASDNFAKFGIKIPFSPNQDWERKKSIPSAKRIDTLSGIITEHVKVLLGLREKLELDDKDIAGLLGLETIDNSVVNNILEGRATLDGRDKQDRIRFAFEIFRALYDILQDLKSVKDWLKENREQFNGDTPLNFMLSGEIEKLLAVRNYTEWLTTR